MKKYLSLLFLCIIPTLSLWAIQGDITLNIPYYIGIHADGEDAGTALDYAFLVPEFKLTQYFGTGHIRAGIGVRMFTVILETLVFPVISIDATINNFVFNANVGGGAFLFFGLLNSVETEGIFIPEFTIAYKITDWFQAGTGINLFMYPGATGDVSSFGYIPTVFGRFTFGN